MIKLPFHRPTGRILRAAWVSLVVVVAGVAAGEWLEWPFLRAPLERFLARTLDRPVVLAPPFGVRLIGSVRLRADRLTIGGTPALLDASDARLVLPYATLWRLSRGQTNDQPLDIESLEVDALRLNLARDAQGRANWHFGAPASAPAAETRPPLPRLGSLVVRSGEITLADIPGRLRVDAKVSTREGTSRVGAAVPGASAPGASASGPSAPGASAPDAFASGTPSGLEVQAGGEYRGLPLKLLLQSSGVLPLLSDARGAGAAVPMRLDLRVGRSHLKLEGTGTDMLHLGTLDARFDLDGPSLAAIGDALGLTLPTTASFAMQGEAHKQGSVWRANVRSLRLGSSRLRGDFCYDTAPAVPLLSGTLAGSRLALADLGPAIGAPAEGTPTAARSGKVLPQREFDIPSLHAMNADVAVRLDVLDLGTSQLEALTPVQAHVQLRDGVLDIRDLVARTADGALRGVVSLDARTALPLWTADLRWSGIDLARFVTARNPRDVEKPSAAAADAQDAPGYVSGVLGGVAKVQGRGRSTAAMLATLDGSARLWVRDGRISHLMVELAGIDIAQSLGVLVAGDTPLPMRCAVAQWTLNQGRAVPEVALIDTGDTTLLATGQVSLADESLGLTLTARPHDISPLALRAPVHIEGSFSQPAVRLDKRSIGLRLAGAAALAAIAPPAALLALIDLGEDDRHVCQDALVRAQRTQPGAAPARAPPARR